MDPNLQYPFGYNIVREWHEPPRVQLYVVGFVWRSKPLWEPEDGTDIEDITLSQADCFQFHILFH